MTPALRDQSGSLSGGSFAIVPTTGTTASTTPTAPTDSVATPSSSATVSSAPVVTAGGAATTVQQARFTGAGDIPGAALQAYQRAAVVINAAIPTCKIQWQLLAAVGRVESNHGQAGGSVLDAQGVAQPAILGPALTGSNSTARVVDSDAGRFDQDKTLDRAVGPMQFIPSTWAVVGVDADGDGQRNPQDINDAALAAAVYLCGGQGDLATDAGQRAAIYRYNHSQSYVDTVLSVMRAYVSGDFSSGPTIVAPVQVTFPSVLTPAQTPFVKSTLHEVKAMTVKPVSMIEDVTPDGEPAPAVLTSPTKPRPSPTTDPTDGSTADPTVGPTTDPTDGPTTGVTTRPAGGPSADPTGSPGPSPSDPPSTPSPSPSPTATTSAPDSSSPEPSPSDPPSSEAAGPTQAQLLAAYQTCLGIGAADLSGCLADELGLASDDQTVLSYVANRPAAPETADASASPSAP